MVIIGAITSSNISILVAFGGGIVSILSPCVLPMIPGYLSLVTGLTVTELQGGEHRHLVRIAAMTGLFALGFTLVFTVLGLAATTLGQTAFRNQETLTRMSGFIVFAMALYLAGSQLLRTPRLYPESAVPGERPLRDAHCADRRGLRSRSAGRRVSVR